MMKQRSHDVVSSMTIRGVNQAGDDTVDPTPAFRESFAQRHIGPSSVHTAQMLDTLNVPDIDVLLDEVLPRSIRLSTPITLPDAIGEEQALAELAELAQRNTTMTSMIGLGYSDTITPQVIVRNVLENPGWYTAYTPYQPEIAQGRLELLLAFQTMIEDLTGLPVAGASLLDEPTAAAEAMTLMRRVSKSAGSRFLVDADTHPQTLAVLRTRAEPLGIILDVCDLTVAGSETEADSSGGEFTDAFGVLLSYPGTSGRIWDPRALIEAAHSCGVAVGVATDLLALTLLTPPGEMGVDVVIGSAQRFGVPMGAGGPHAGFMSVRAGWERHLPGRLVGVSVDADGAPAYRLALQTREQHIRREKATSNICTAQVLLAIVSALYAAYHGPHGLRAIAERVHGHAADLDAGLRSLGLTPLHDQFFDTVIVATGKSDLVVKALAARGINVRRVDDDSVSMSVDEVTCRTDVENVITGIAAALNRDVPDSPLRHSGDSISHLPSHLIRTSPYLSHPIFNDYQSETAMMRFLRRLSDRDLALDRTMIPLGSCTMKLNSATEMAAITWPGFARIHPFAPGDQLAGYAQLIHQLESWLTEITGYAAVSIQPNAGSQGEFAGLLAIRGYHRSRGDDHRDVCIIPSSAHGTNAASAVMAGMRVVVAPCDDDGNVDVAALRSLTTEHEEHLAALMITYPSTHGVFEESVVEICDIVHSAGGQVYVDGANLNALVGLAAPGRFGADVSHLNLHKTFCIPHGGGGPGVGPVAVAQHLAPFLPRHPLAPRADIAPTVETTLADGPYAVGPVSGAPWGSAGILPIPWAYIRMMGAQGLTAASVQAILSANYISARLATAYPTLYVGERGRVAHECILDIRPLTKATGVTVDDIAKRLIDYGFHAPTMSFPVAGTLMIEPTESEDIGEIDRFIDAMLGIREEIAAIERGEWSVEDSPLRGAPHTAQCLIGEWDRPYSRELAAYPVASLRQDRYWPPVRRIDGAFGDRNLVCSCPAPEAFARAGDI